ncbi:MAG: hypothetical protein FJ387_23230 [Verrucomicrobia bacterium]|nr:hypothetical protein [Verrucomicrobiota bacterium]
MKPSTPSTQPTALTDRYVTLRWLAWLVHPRRLRIYLGLLLCLITVIGLVYGLVNWRGHRAWNRLERQLTAAGERLDLEAFVPPRVSADENLAMTPFLAPLFDFEPGTQQWRDTNAVARIQSFGRGLPSARGASGGWRLGEFADLAEWALELQPAVDPKDRVACARVVLEGLEPYAAVLAELRAASERPHCRFNIRYEQPNPAEILLPHLSLLRTVVELLAWRASANLALGQAELAFADVSLGLELVDAIRQEPILISFLVRCANLESIAQPIWEGLARRQWSAVQLEALQQRCQRFELWQDGRHALRAERAMGHAIIELARTQPALLENLGAVGPDDDLRTTPGLVSLLLKLLPSGLFRLELVQYHRLFQLAVLSPSNPEARWVDPAQAEAAAQILDRELSGGPWARLSRHQVLASILLPALSKVYQKAAREQALADQLVLATALERSRLARGHFPEALGELAPEYLTRVPADIVQGDPYRYARTPDGQFTLYSVAWDGIDDGGQIGRDHRGRWDGSRGDWVWRYP